METMMNVTCLLLIFFSVILSIGILVGCIIAIKEKKTMDIEMDKLISESAKVNAERYIPRFQKVAEAAFEEGAMWMYEKLKLEEKK